jgi:hypothetical protein
VFVGDENVEVMRPKLTLTAGDGVDLARIGLLDVRNVTKLVANLGLSRSHGTSYRCVTFSNFAGHQLSAA